MAKTVKNQTFGDDKVRVTKQIVRSNCITLDQLIVLLNEFDWDDGKKLQNLLMIMFMI